MRFLIKAIFWFTVVLLVLPEHPEQEQQATTAANNPPAAPPLKSSDLIATLSALCAEESDLCTRGAEALAAVDIDTEQGMRVALTLLHQARNAQPAQPAD